MIWFYILAGVSLAYLLFAFAPIVLSNLRLYRRILGGRWEKRGHWTQYPHCESQTDWRVNKYGVADDVEDW